MRKAIPVPLRGAALLAAATVLVSLGGAIMLAEHDCVGDECLICLCINVCGSLLRGLFGALCTCAVPAAALLAVCAACGGTGERAPHTPVSLYVRLND